MSKELNTVGLMTLFDGKSDNPARSLERRRRNKAKHEKKKMQKRKYKHGRRGVHNES